MADAILSGAVLACGALFVLSGAAKLWRVIGRVDSGGAIRAALRVSAQRWRFVELAAALAELGTGSAVCSGFHPVVAGGAMAGPILLPGDPSAPMQASTKQYVDGVVQCLNASAWAKTPAASGSVQ